MRKFTEKDITALARAFQTFMGYCEPQQTTVKKLRPIIEMALAEGITADELLNRANYTRAKETEGAMSPQEYVRALVERKAIVRQLTEEKGWDDNETFEFIAQIYHDFFLEVTGKGGNYNTINAKVNLRRAIDRHSLQELLSEELIAAAAERNGFNEKMTCFQYINTVLSKMDNNEIKSGLSEEQEERKKREAETLKEMDGNPETTETNIPTVTLETECNHDGNDISIFGEPEIPEIIIEELPETQNEDVIIKTIDPKKYKRDAVRDILFALTLDELTSITSLCDDRNKTLEEFLRDICEGKYRNKEENGTLKTAHDWINGQLMQRFNECLQLQGIAIEEHSMQGMDLLYDDWDMRDCRTRKLHKLRNLIYENDLPDPDLIKALEDLEHLYESEQADEN